MFFDLSRTFSRSQLPESELESRATVIHNDAGFSNQDKIGLHDIARFENQLDIKIVVFYRTSAGALETFKNHGEFHPKTMFLYLHDEHYYMILNLTAFIGASYVCQFCYKGYEKFEITIVNTSAMYVSIEIVSNTLKKLFTAPIVCAIVFKLLLRHAQEDSARQRESPLRRYKILQAM